MSESRSGQYYPKAEAESLRRAVVRLMDSWPELARMLPTLSLHAGRRVLAPDEMLAVPLSVQTRARVASVALELVWEGAIGAELRLSLRPDVNKAFRSTLLVQSTVLEPSVTIRDADGTAAMPVVAAAQLEYTKVQGAMVGGGYDGRLLLVAKGGPVLLHSISGHVRAVD